MTIISRSTFCFSLSLPALFLCVTAACFAQNRAPAQRDSTEERERFPCAAIFYDVKTAVHDAGAVFSAPLRFDSRDWLYTGAALALTGAAMTADEPVRDLVKRNSNKRTSDALQIGEFYGRVTVSAGLAGGLYLVGLVSGEEYIRETGLMLAEALCFAGATTTLIKSTAGRSRPERGEGAFKYNGPSFTFDKTSLPSGHATVAFAFSTVLANRIDHPVASVVLFALAGATALERIYDDRHWTSDVFLGAVIGTVFGRAVIGEHDKPRGGGISFAPALSPYGQGFSMAIVF
jgi:hypothetical protein